MSFEIFRLILVVFIVVDVASASIEQGVNPANAPQVSAWSQRKALEADRGSSILNWNERQQEKFAPLVSEGTKQFARSRQPGIPVSKTTFVGSRARSAESVHVLSSQEAAFIAAAGLGGPVAATVTRAATESLADAAADAAAKAAKAAKDDADFRAVQAKIQAKLTKNFTGPEAESRAMLFFLGGVAVSVLAVVIIFLAERLWLMQTLGVPSYFDDKITLAMYPFL